MTFDLLKSPLIKVLLITASTSYVSKSIAQSSASVSPSDRIDNEFSVKAAVELPILVGRQLSEVSTQLEELDISFEISNYGGCGDVEIVTGQYPKAGSLVSPETAFIFLQIHSEQKRLIPNVNYANVEKILREEGFLPFIERVEVIATDPASLDYRRCIYEPTSGYSLESLSPPIGSTVCRGSKVTGQIVRVRDFRVIACTAGQKGESIRDLDVYLPQ